MVEYKSENANPATRYFLSRKGTDNTIHTWQFGAGTSRKPGECLEPGIDYHIRLLLPLTWLFVTGMWLSFPVLDLKDSNTGFGSAILRYQRLAALDHPLISFLLFSMAFALASVALVSSVEELKGCLATILVADFVAIVASIRMGATNLQALLLVTPLSTVLALTSLIAFQKRFCKTHQDIIPT